MSVRAPRGPSTIDRSSAGPHGRRARPDPPDNVPAPPFNPLRRIGLELRRDRGKTFPPGPTDFSVERTRAVTRDPLSVILDLYRDYGPVSAARIGLGMHVMMIGPEANHFMLVQAPENFRWRDGNMGDLIPLVGDGLLTIDGAYHDDQRRIMMPAFHSETLARSADIMLAETLRAIDRWEPGSRVDLYSWARTLAMRIALRGLFGIDPDARVAGDDPGRVFENALRFYAYPLPAQQLRGPFTPWAALGRHRRRLDEFVYAEIARRRRAGGDGSDLISLLLAATDEAGHPLDDRQVRDHVMTLMFAGHDTTTSTVSFLFYELAKNPAARDSLHDEVDRVLADRDVTADDLMGDALPCLDMVLDETLRLYPAAWIGPRRANEDIEFGGHTIPRDTSVSYVSWASHRLPDVFPDPEAFVPERFSGENVAKLPRGAYVPFGGGSRICIGKRFGQMEIKTIVSAVARRFRLELEPGYTMSVRQMPTLSPRHGVPVIVRSR